MRPIRGADDDVPVFIRWMAPPMFDTSGGELNASHRGQQSSWRRPHEGTCDCHTVPRLLGDVLRPPEGAVRIQKIRPSDLNSGVSRFDLGDPILQRLRGHEDEENVFAERRGPLRRPHGGRTWLRHKCFELRRYVFMWETSGNWFDLDGSKC
jgi:hypothetical protein